MVLALPQDFESLILGIGLFIALHIILCFVQYIPQTNLLFSGHIQSIWLVLLTPLYIVFRKQFSPFTQKSDNLGFEFQQLLDDPLNFVNDLNTSKVVQYAF